ncbi:MAG: alpha/beta hydrolase [Frankiales bacterium]|nr:alpha/beta hydrolase [Frankiales bacterium]
MQTQARLIDVALPSDPQGVVLVLHGGASRAGNMMVSPTQLSVLRMIPIAKRIVRAGGGRLAVFRLLNSVRGWDSRHTPVDDARWALAQLAARFGQELSTCLVGHSLGGRAALLAAGEPAVVSAVALAPWVYPTDGGTNLAGRKILIVHGSADRIAQPKNSVAVARNIARSAQVSYVRVERGKHAMLRHHRIFDGLAADFAAATLLGGQTSGTVELALAGEQWIDV